MWEIWDGVCEVLISVRLTWDVGGRSINDYLRKCVLTLSLTSDHLLRFTPSRQMF